MDLKFKYADVKQRTAEWFEIKRGKIGASSISRWLAVSKSKTNAGKPLKDRLDYEKELMFERQFNVTFTRYFNSAMEDGIMYEDFACAEYERITGNTCLPAGVFYNDFLAVSPDRFVGEDGLLEIKILKDNSFLEVISSNAPLKDHWQQIQTQLLATKAKWCDYVALNLNTMKIKIIRVFPDKEFQEYVILAIQEKFFTEPFSMDGVYEITSPMPDGWSFEENKTLTDTGENSWA